MRGGRHEIRKTSCMIIDVYRTNISDFDEVKFANQQIFSVFLQLTRIDRKITRDVFGIVVFPGSG